MRSIIAFCRREQLIYRAEARLLCDPDWIKTITRVACPVRHDDRLSLAPLR